MTIKVDIICDSISQQGIRLTTYVLSYPRIIHSEFMTHRTLSRNGSSTRAIPIKKQSKIVLNDSFVPEPVYTNQSGMSPTKNKIKGLKLFLVKCVYSYFTRSAVLSSRMLDKLGVHKQWAGRFMEPSSHIKIVVTGTEWDNFFELRDHEDAQQEFRDLARAMRIAYDESVPIQLGKGHWHLPYVSYSIVGDKQIFSEGYKLEDAKIVSASCCAQVSYRALDTSIKKAKIIFHKLIKSKPVHASPIEHQATPIYGESQATHKTLNDGILWSANFKGWEQFRHSKGLSKHTK